MIYHICTGEMVSLEITGLFMNVDMNKLQLLRSSTAEDPYCLMLDPQEVSSTVSDDQTRLFLNYTFERPGTYFFSIYSNYVKNPFIDEPWRNLTGNSNLPLCS